MLKLIKLSIIFLLIFNVFSIFALTVSAADPEPTQTTFLPNTESGGGKCPDGYDKGSNGNCGNYSLNDMVSVILKISEFILSLVGSLALLAFVVGGLMWLLSAGNPEMVNRGKQAIIGAVVGLVIVFTSYMIIQLVYTALGIPNTSKGEWAISGWFNKK